MRKKIAMCLAVVTALVLLTTVVLAGVALADDEVWSGNGTEGDPYIISDEAQFRELAAKVNAGETYKGKYFKISNDFAAAGLDLSEKDEWTPIGGRYTPFQGNFDGNNLTIKNLTIVKEAVEGTENRGIGVFGNMDGGSNAVKNLNVENATLKGYVWVAPIVGRMYTGTEISNCNVTGHIELEGVQYVGGIAGRSEYSDIKNCKVNVDESSTIKVQQIYGGGIAGFRSEDGTVISNCEVSNVTVSGEERVGGIAGLLHYGNTIQDCSVSNIIVEAEYDVGTAGLIAGANQSNGTSIPKIINCTVDADSNVYAEGSVIASRPLVGECNNVGEPAKGAIVGTDVEFDDNGKITSGNIEIVGSTAIEVNDLFAENTTATVTGGEVKDGKLVTYVAEVGDDGYATLEEALAAANGDDNTVTLLKNLALSAAVNISDSVTIDGNGYSFTRASGYTGTFFTVAENATLKLDNVHIDAGGKWSIDETKWEADKAISLNNLSVYDGDGKNWENGAADPITVNSGNVTTNANLITLNGNSNLTLTGGTIIENIYATTNVHVIGVGGTDNNINIEDATIKHFAGTDGSLMITTNDSGSKTITLGSKAVLTDNYNLSGNGGLFYLNSTDTLTMADGAEVTNNRGVNSNGTFIMTRSGATFTMNGGLISKNVGLKGGSNGYCQPVYAHLNGTFIMTGGEITDNTGCYVGAVYQRIDNSADHSNNGKVTLTGGKIYDNHYYGEDEGALTESSLGQVFITDEAEIGKDMNITGDVSFYGQSKATVEGTIDGNVHIFAEQYVAGVADNNVELKGTITGNVIIENGAKATNSGTIRGNVTVEPQDKEDDNHSNGDFVNSDEGTISGTVTLEPGTSVQLGEGTVTAGENGAEFTVSGSTVTLTKGTLDAEDCESLTFRDTDNNVLEPANGNGNGEVMIVVARVTHGNQVNMGFDNFADAVAYAKSQSEASNGALYTVTLLKDAEGVGIDIAPTAGNSPSIVIDFGGHTYTLTGSPVGSAGTRTQGMRFNKGATVTLKNGTLKVGTGPDKFLWLINNYGSLTVENMTLDGTNLVMPGNPKEIYTLNNNSGEVNITKTTFIDSNSQAEGKIYSVCSHYSMNYGTVSKVTIDSESVFNNVIVTRDADDDTTVNDMMAYVEYNGVKYGIDATDKTADSYIVFTKTGDTLTPKLPDSNLNYSAIADPSIVDPCAAQTMWVLFKDPLPANTWLWFEITDTDGPVYGIAGKAETATTKMAWSFLNKGQFESWPEDVEGIAAGDVTVKCYVLPGKVEGKVAAAPETKYLVWEKTVTVSNVTAYTPAPEVTVDESLEDDKVTLTEAAESTAIDEAHMNDLAAEALTDANDQIPTQDAAKDDLEAGGVTVADDTTVQIVVETYLDVTVKEYVTEGNDKKLTFDIHPMYQVVATTAETVEEIELGTNAVAIGSPHELPVTDPVTMTLGVPSDFLGGSTTIYVQHVKENDRTYYYRAKVGRDNTITFTNPHGFSTFTVIVTAPEFKAEIGDTLYETLKDAVDHVQNGETIVVTGDCSEENVTVSRSVSFSVTVSGDGTVGTITAGGGYSMTSSVSGTTTTYTVTYSGGGSVSGSSTYTVSAEEAENAEVELSTEKATAGDSVTVTVTPAENFHVSGVTVTGADGKEITVVDNGDGTFTFTMPSGGVTVKAETFKCPSVEYTDIDVTEWYHDYVDYAITHDLMEGVGDGVFAPEKTVTRAQMAGILWNLEGQPVVNYLMTFTDVPDGKWYTEAIRWAASEGIISGFGDDTFRPEDIITREQMAAMLYFYEEYKNGDHTVDAELTFTDSGEVSSWANEAVVWCVGKDLIHGKGDNAFDPRGTSIRAQLATLLALYDQMDK